MKIFISWSKEKSGLYAQAIKEWLPNVIQKLDLFISSEDISKGGIWFNKIAQELEETNFGIVCITPENYNEPWILFESGAIYKKVNTSKICAVLFDMEKGELKGPLSHFNLTDFSKNEFFKLVKSVNESLAENKLDNAILGSSFEKWWGDLEERITKIRETYKNSKPVKRGTDDMVSEILINVREIRNNMTSSASSSLRDRISRQIDFSQTQNRNSTDLDRIEEQIDEIKKILGNTNNLLGTGFKEPYSS